MDLYGSIIAGVPVYHVLEVRIRSCSPFKSMETVPDFRRCHHPPFTTTVTQIASRVSRPTRSVRAAPVFLAWRPRGPVLTRAAWLHIDFQGDPNAVTSATINWADLLRTALEHPRRTEQPRPPGQLGRTQEAESGSSICPPLKAGGFSPPLSLAACPRSSVSLKFVLCRASSVDHRTATFISAPTTRLLLSRADCCRAETSRVLAGAQGTPRASLRSACPPFPRPRTTAPSAINPEKRHVRYPTLTIAKPDDRRDEPSVHLVASIICPRSSTNPRRAAPNDPCCSPTPERRRR